MIAGTCVGQHLPGQPTVVVITSTHAISKQSGGGTWAVQGPLKAVTTLVGHGAGVTTVRGWDPAEYSGRSKVVVMSGQAVVEGLARR